MTSPLDSEALKLEKRIGESSASAACVFLVIAIANVCMYTTNDYKTHHKRYRCLRLVLGTLKWMIATCKKFKNHPPSAQEQRKNQNYFSNQMTMKSVYQLVRWEYFRMKLLEKIDHYKRAIDEIRPFESHLLNELKNYYRIGLTWSSNALEGNTLTESETKVLLEDGLTVGGKPLSDTFEALGHAKAYDFMFTILGNRQISEDDALTMHRLFLKDINLPFAGKYRTDPVLITGSKYPVCKVKEIEAEMKTLFHWVASERMSYHPVEFAAQLHKRFVFIHPFIDGNGRISRLLMNSALLQDGYMLAIIPPILRQEYISLLEQAHTNDQPFIDFIAERVLESEKDIMRLLHISIP